MLHQCLQTIAAQSRQVAEVLIVHCGDDQETERTANDPVWQHAGLVCRYFRHPVRNAAAQRNFAAARTTCEVLLLLDDDVELAPDWCAELVAPIERDATVGATMGALTNQRLEPPSWYWRLYRQMAGGARALEPGRLAGAALPNGFPDRATTAIAAEWLGGGIAAIRRTAFESVGGFAPYFDGSSPGEDLDLGLRLSHHWRVLFVPAAHAVHHSASGGRSPSAEYQYQSIRSRFAILMHARGLSRAGALGQVLLWMAFQFVSEVGALLRGRGHGFGAVWSGRVRGLRSCLRWQPAAPQHRAVLFPGATP